MRKRRGVLIAAMVLTGAATGDAAAQESPADFFKRLFQPPIDAISDALRPAVKRANKPAAATKLTDVPMPHPRPPDAAPKPLLGYFPETDPTVTATPSPPSTPGLAALPAEPMPLTPPPPAARSTCGVALARLGVDAKALAPIAEDQCGIASPVAVASLNDGAVDLSTKLVVSCDLAETLADWIDSTVQLRAEAILNDRVTGLRVAASYACRNRDGLADAELSEHAKGNAIDISAFRVGEHWIDVKSAWGSGGEDADFLAAIRTSACGPFKTVLGPGSDEFHTDHFHFDLAQRRSGATYCH